MKPTVTLPVSAMVMSLSMPMVTESEAAMLAEKELAIVTLLVAAKVVVELAPSVSEFVSPTVVLTLSAMVRESEPAARVVIEYMLRAVVVDETVPAHTVSSICVVSMVVFEYIDVAKVSECDCPYVIEGSVLSGFFEGARPMWLLLTLLVTHEWLFIRGTALPS